MSESIYREMARCATCRAWWSIGGDNIMTVCPCGGQLKIVDMEAHIKTLPYHPFGKPNGKPDGT